MELRFHALTHRFHSLPTTHSIHFNSLRPADAYYVSELDHLCFRQWLAAFLGPSQNLNQCWHFINWILWNKLNQNAKIFFHDNEFEMTSAKYRPFCPGLSVLIHFTGHSTVCSETTKKASQLCIASPLAGNPPASTGFPAQRASNAESVSMLWRHHGFHLFSPGTLNPRPEDHSQQRCCGHGLYDSSRDLCCHNTAVVQNEARSLVCCEHAPGGTVDNHYFTFGSDAKLPLQ